MKPYRRHTPLRFRLVRRLRYGRGHGVHSPRAYALVHSLVRPRHTYYPSIKGHMDALLFRMVARLKPSACIIDATSKTLCDTARLACSDMAVTAYNDFVQYTRLILLITHDTEKAIEFLSDNRSGLRYVLLLGIRSDRERYHAFRSIPNAMSHGTILDLYECAILYNSDNELYIYRSSL